MKVVVARAPAPLEFDVLAIDLPVRVDLDRSVVGVVTADDHATAVAHHVESLRDRVGCAARFDHDVDAATTGESRECSRRSASAEDRARASRSRPCAARIRAASSRRADGDDLAGAGERRERDDRLTHGTDAEHGDGFAESDLGHVDGVQRGHETAAAADEGFRCQLLRQLDHLHARLHPDRFGPSAEQAVVRAVADAVDLARRTLRRLTRDETVVAVVAGLVDVEKGDDVAFLDVLPSMSLSVPPDASTMPTDTCPGMIGNGTSSFP